MLWNSGTEADKAFVRSKSKRRLSYYSNIYVVKDPANPENEGKVFLYKYGKRIFDKLNEAMNPEFDDETPMNPFDLWEGSNFRLKIRKVEGYRNYDKSEFDSPSALSEDDDDLESVWKQEKSLKALVDPSAFKSYDELKAKLYRVLDLDGGGTANTVTAEELGAKEPAEKKQRSAAPVKEDLPPWDEDVEPEAQSDAPTMSFFEKLAEED